MAEQEVKRREVVVNGIATTMKLTDEQYAAYQQNEEQQLSAPPGEPQTSEVDTKKRSASNKSK